MSQNEPLTILGGGPAGLALAYYAGKAGIPFTLYEASSEIGGNARTLSRGLFHYDSGAHRLHDKNPEVTAELLALLGDDLQKVCAPSHIIHHGKFVDFPLSPLNLLVALGLPAFFRASLSLLRERVRGKGETPNFENHAVYQYGRDIAGRFLLGYSQKLWGRPCAQLSPRISGSRLKGLTLKTFIKEFVAGKQAKTEHLDGEFYYPRKGYGQIIEALADAAGRENIHTGARITRIHHEEGIVTGITINDEEKIPVSHVANTLPLPLFIRLLDPLPSEEILEVASAMHFRDLLLVVLILDRPAVSNSATIYFPDPEVPFTRGYEPRNRSDAMAPEGKTSFCVEIPCNRFESIWAEEEPVIVARVVEILEQFRLLSHDEVIDSVVHRMPNAYPVLEVGFDQRAGQLLALLGEFENLDVIGRNGLFLYTHLHDQMRAGREVIEKISGQGLP